MVATSRPTPPPAGSRTTAQPHPHRPTSIRGRDSDADRRDDTATAFLAVLTLASAFGLHRVFAGGGWALAGGGGHRCGARNVLVHETPAASRSGPRSPFRSL